MDAIATFENLKLREVTEDDYPILEEWIAADPEHASTMIPDFFMGREVNEQGEIAPDPRATCYALEDEKGTVFYIRLSRAVRVYIQFPPAREITPNPKRTALGLVKGMAFLEVALDRAGAEEWIFNSFSSKLRKLAQRALGFRESPDEMVRSITRLRKPKNPLGHEQQVQGRSN